MAAVSHLTRNSATAGIGIIIFDFREIPMPVAALEKTDKQFLLDKIGQLPDTASIEDISDEIAMLAAIRRGLADSDAGRLVSHDEVKRRSATWISK